MVEHSPCENSNCQPNCQCSGKYWLTPSYHRCDAKTHVFDANFQKQLLSGYKRKSKIKSEEYAKFVANKKSLIAIIFGECDEATKTKIALWATYTANRQAGNLIEFSKQLGTVCFGSDDGVLSYGPYEQVVVSSR